MSSLVEQATSPGLTTNRAPFIEQAQASGRLYITQPYELYSDEDSFKSHGGSDAMKAAFGALAGITEGRPEILMGTPVDAKGVKF